MTENKVETTEPIVQVAAEAPAKVAVAEEKSKTAGKSGGSSFDPMKKKKRTTEYGQQLAEKQLAKKTYGVRERQFRNYYEKALSQKGDTGDIIRQMLQMRLDSVVHQAGLAKTLRAARQMVSHNYFLVNGKKVNIPSYQVKIKDIISIKPEKQGKKIWDEELKDLLANKTIASWMAVDKKEKTIKVVSAPTGSELDQSFNARLIVEFYSR